MFIAGGAGLYFASTALPLQYQVPAKVAGAGLALWGLLELVKTGTSAIGKAGGLGDLASDAAFGISTGEVERVDVARTDVLTKSTARRSVIGLAGDFLDPPDGGNARKSALAGSYPVKVSIANRTDSTVIGVARLELQEDYVFGSSEKVSVVSDVLSIAPRHDKVLTLRVPVGGGRVILSTPQVLARLFLNDRPLATAFYWIK